MASNQLPLPPIIHSQEAQMPPAKSNHAKTHSVDNTSLQKRNARPVNFSRPSTFYKLENTSSSESSKLYSPNSSPTKHSLNSDLSQDDVCTLTTPFLCPLPDSNLFPFFFLSLVLSSLYIGTFLLNRRLINIKV